MSVNHLEPFVRKLAIIWGVLLGVTTALMILILTRGEASITLNSTLVIFLVVIKFLAGLGTPMGLATLTIIAFTRFEKWFSGEKNRANVRRFIYFILFVLIVLLIYQGPYRITTSIINPGAGQNFLDIILYVYGIISLFLTVYLMPLWKERFFVYKVSTEKDALKNAVSATVKGVKTRFLTWRKEYAKVELQKQTTLKGRLDELRREIAIFTFIFIGIGCLIFTPLCAIFIMIWLRIYLLYDDKRPLRYEVHLLITASAVIAVIAVMFPFLPLTFYDTILNYSYLIFIAQFIGLSISCFLYMSELLRPILQDRRKKKMKALQEEKKGLKKEQKNLQKSQKSLQKEKKKLEKQLQKSSPQK